MIPSARVVRGAGARSTKLRVKHVKMIKKPSARARDLRAWGLLYLLYLAGGLLIGAFGHSLSVEAVSNPSPFFVDLLWGVGMFTGLFIVASLPLFFSGTRS